MLKSAFLHSRRNFFAFSTSAKANTDRKGDADNRAAMCRRPNSRMQATGRQKASEKVNPDGKTNGGPGAGDRAAACRRPDGARANYRRAGRGRPSGKTNEGPGEQPAAIRPITRSTVQTRLDRNPATARTSKPSRPQSAGRRRAFGPTSVKKLRRQRAGPRHAHGGRYRLQLRRHEELRRRMRQDAPPFVFGDSLA